MNQDPETGEGQQVDPQAIISNLLEKFDYMFQHDSLMKSAYLINRANLSMELPLDVIYNEQSVSSITNNPELINEALKACKLITFDEGKKLIKVNKSALRRKVAIRHMDASNEELFKKQVLIEKFLPQHGLEPKDIDVEYYPKTNCLTIIFKGDDDEKNAMLFLKWICGELFNSVKIDCNLEEESLFCLYKEQMKKNKRPGPGMKGPYMKYPYQPYVYQMPAYTPYQAPGGMYYQSAPRGRGGYGYGRGGTRGYGRGGGGGGRGYYRQDEDGGDYSQQQQQYTRGPGGGGGRGGAGRFSSGDFPTLEGGPQEEKKD